MYHVAIVINQNRIFPVMSFIKLRSSVTFSASNEFVTPGTITHKNLESLYHTHLEHSAITTTSFTMFIVGTWSGRSLDNNGLMSRGLNETS